MSDAAQQKEVEIEGAGFAIDITVNGTPVTADADTLAELAGAPEAEQALEVATALARWRAIQAEAECEAARVDALYRAWSAETYCALLAKDAKLSEWKVKASTEDHPTFRHYKEAQARAQRNITLARGMSEAIQVLAGYVEP